MCENVCFFPVSWLLFLGVAYSSLLLGFGRFRERWGPKGPTSPNPSFLWCFCFSCVGFVFVVVALFCFVAGTVSNSRVITNSVQSTYPAFLKCVLQSDSNKMR